MKRTFSSALLTGLVILCSPYLFSTINFSPLQPNVEQPVTFTVSHASGIVPFSVQWSFGDGTSATGTLSVTKAYHAPGSFLVRASYNTQKQDQISDQIAVTIAERRKITISLLYPSVNRPVTFRAENFLSASVLWNFGDDTQPGIAPPVTTHTYQRPGRYTVRARDSGGQSLFIFSALVNVTEGTGPRAAFQIFYLELRFEDGKAYKVVPKDFQPLMAFADIKYEGTGILQGQWLVDGVPFKPFSQSLVFAGQTVITSGLIPGFPTVTPGIHKISLRILNPPTAFNIPVIRYFVSMGREAKGIQRETADLLKAAITDLKGSRLPFEADTITAPGKAYFLFKGTVKSDNPATIPFALLRIYLENKLIDQQILKDLKPREEREFTTSIANPTSETKRIYVALYNISVKPAGLLFSRKFLIEPQGSKEAKVPQKK
jgi:hypothetical protein